MGKKRLEELVVTMREENRRGWEQLDRMRHESRRYFEIENEKLNEQLAESRAQRAALFRMLDKLDGRGDQPPA